MKDLQLVRQHTILCNHPASVGIVFYMRSEYVARFVYLSVNDIEYLVSVLKHEQNSSLYVCMSDIERPIYFVHSLPI